MTGTGKLSSHGIGKKKMKNNLPYPFNKALEHGDSIHYKVGDWSTEKDHNYVVKLGYKPEMVSDCTYFTKGLSGLSLSSYGNWGSIHMCFSDEKSVEVFLDMFEKGIIRLWRISAYFIVDGKAQEFLYVNGTGWTRYDQEYGWVDYIGDPYKEYVK